MTINEPKGLDAGETCSATATVADQWLTFGHAVYIYIDCPHVTTLHTCLVLTWGRNVAAPCESLSPKVCQLGFSVHLFLCHQLKTTLQAAAPNFANLPWLQTSSSRENRPRPSRTRRPDTSLNDGIPNKPKYANPIEATPQRTGAPNR